jgi:solute:Na+ symporter, SSS family
VFLISIAVTVELSLLTAPPPEAKIRSLTYASVTPEQAAANRRSWGTVEVASTAMVMLLVLAMYLYFSFWLD